MEFARAAEEAGFDGIGFTDHPAPTQRWISAGGHDALDPFAALAFAAAVTERLLLIPNIVVLPYRNPFLAAKSAATVDALSDGRLVLAVGTGYLKGEYRALGVDFDERNELFDEAVEVMRGVWTTDDFRYEGRHFTAHGQTVNPKPSRPVPIWIGGNSRLSRRRVATTADGWVPFPAPRGLATTTRTPPLETVGDLRAMLDDLWRQTEAAGRDPADIDVLVHRPRRRQSRRRRLQPRRPPPVPGPVGRTGSHLVRGPHARRLPRPRPRRSPPLRRVSDPRSVQRVGISGRVERCRRLALQRVSLRCLTPRARSGIHCAPAS